MKRRPPSTMPKPEKTSRPMFKPKLFMHGSGWHVDAEWPYGVTQYVDDFGPDLEAREWIAKKSEAYLKTPNT